MTQHDYHRKYRRAVLRNELQFVAKAGIIFATGIVVGMGIMLYVTGRMR